MAKREKRAPAILVFGEDENDRETIKQLLRGLRPDAPRIEKRRKPIVLSRNAAEAKRRKNLRQMAAVARADGERFDVKLIVAHADADEVEPGHEPLALEIEEEVQGFGFPVIGAVPAWEMETWLFLWPDAAKEVNSRWKRPVAPRKTIGKIREAKEAYRRALRPRVKGKRPRGYLESDCPRIASAIVRLDLVRSPDVDLKSTSWTRFREKLDVISF